MKKQLFATIFFVLCLFVVSCASAKSTYIERDYAKNLDLLKTCEPYISNQAGAASFNKEYLVDAEQAAKIREYFLENAGLDLDALAASSKTTWEKAVELAVFVAKNIPHDNQKEFLVNRNAISLWEYSRKVPTGFNCRWHATLLSELMLSIGIRNSFVVCLPYDKNDGDCHVVNNVWLEELNKWAMIDSDMTEYITGENDIPLSLQEMREYIQQDKAFKVNVLPDFEKSWVAAEAGKNYMKAYWTKNLYWFALYSVYSFDLEYARNEDGTTIFEKYYTLLVPPGYDSSYIYEDCLRISDAETFWKY